MMVRGVKMRQMLGCAVVLGLVLAVVGVVCVEYHLVVLRDVWRDATMVRPGASQLQPVPAPVAAARDGGLARRRCYRRACWAARQAF